MDRTFNLIGPGRAGGSLAKAMIERGWELHRTIFREDDPGLAAHDVALCIVATPDSAIEHTASLVEPADAVLMHLSGVTPLRSLGSHRAAALHPLVSLPDPHTGAERLADAWFGIGGEPIAEHLAGELSGRWFRLDDSDRPLYHAAATIAASHLVALVGQAQRIADEVGLPPEALLELVRATVKNVDLLGPVDALTGPAARDDDATIQLHLDALRDRLPAEVPAYLVMLDEARRLAAQRPADR